jgi:hypothetical protein
MGLCCCTLHLCTPVCIMLTGVWCYYRHQTAAERQRLCPVLCVHVHAHIHIHI